MAFAPRPFDPAASKGKLALVFSILGMVLCCSPLGIVGGVFAIQSLKMAKDRGTSAPATAILALVFAGCSLVTFALGSIGVWRDKQARDQRIEETSGALAGKLDKEQIDQQTACLLVEKELLKGLYQGKTSIKHVRCIGPYERDEKKATLRNVQAEVVAEKKTFTACYARASRWFVVALQEGAEPCPTAALPPTSGGANRPEDVLDAEEEGLRKGVAEREESARVEAFMGRLAKVEESVRAMPHEPTTCPPLDVSQLAPTDGRLVVSAVDFDYLTSPADARDASDDWSFMTHESVKTALDAKRSSRDRSEAVRQIVGKGGPYLVVFEGTERDWPDLARSNTLFKKKGFIGGGYVGWLIVVDTEAAKPLCAQPIAFENSKSVRTSRNASDSEVMRRLKDDLKKNFELEAGKKIREMTGGKLRFGYSILN